MTTTRQNKVARLLQKELGEFFQKEARTFGGPMITVTIVRISPDLGDAKVYVSIFGSPKPDEVLENIRSKYKMIRTKLGEKVKSQLRIVPNLTFFRDDSLDYAEKIDNLLKK